MLTEHIIQSVAVAELGFTMPTRVSTGVYLLNQAYATSGHRFTEIIFQKVCGCIYLLLLLVCPYLLICAALSNCTALRYYLKGFIFVSENNFNCASPSNSTALYLL